MRKIIKTILKNKIENYDYDYDEIDMVDELVERLEDDMELKLSKEDKDYVEEVASEYWEDMKSDMSPAELGYFRNWGWEYDSRNN